MLAHQQHLSLGKPSGFLQNRVWYAKFANVVQVRKPYAKSLDEMLSVRRTAGEEDAVDRVQQSDETDRDIADMNNTVVREHRRMRPWIRKELRVVMQDLKRGLGLDRTPEALLEEGPDVARQMLIEFRHRTLRLHRHTVTAGC